jgi:hypothetical protein
MATGVELVGGASEERHAPDARAKATRMARGALEVVATR